MPCYSLYLVNKDVTLNTPIKYVRYNTGINAGATANTRLSTTWNIDFDALFNYENANYKKCRVRIKTLSANQDAPVSFSVGSGNMCASLSTDFNSQRTIDKTLLTGFYTAYSPVGILTSNLPMNTMSTVGVNINVPRGQQEFTISFQDLTFNNLLVFTSASWLVNFLLIFELYD